MFGKKNRKAIRNEIAVLSEGYETGTISFKNPEHSSFILISNRQVHTMRLDGFKIREVKSRYALYQSKTSDICYMVFVSFYEDDSLFSLDMVKDAGVLRRTGEPEDLFLNDN